MSEGDFRNMRLLQMYICVLYGISALLSDNLIYEFWPNTMLILMLDLIIIIIYNIYNKIKENNTFIQ